MLFPRPWKQGATKLLTHHPQASHFPSFPFSRKTDPGWQLASSRLNASFHGVLRDGGLPGYFWLGAFSGLHSVSGLKWPSLYLQNVNWRCHGDRTTLPGSVKIHFSLWVGRGQERNPRRCPGEDGGSGEDCTGSSGVGKTLWTLSDKTAHTEPFASENSNKSLQADVTY